MDEDGERRARRARRLLILAVVVIGGSVALVLQQDPPASVGAGVAAAACVLLLSGIADPFLLMLGGNGSNPFVSTRRDRDALLAPVEPRTGPPPEPGMWRTDAVFGELARLAEADGGELEVLRTRRRVRIARTDARSLDAPSQVACDLVVIGHQLLEHREVGDPDALRRSMHALIDRLIATTSWQIGGERVER